MTNLLPCILMLEDDHDDRWLTTNVLDSLNLPVSIKFVSDSTKVFSNLQDQAPVLILLDYNTHPENGLEVLKKIKTNTSFRHIPVVILGDTADPDFIKKCYSEGANSYAVKPSSVEATKTKIRLFFQYWLSVAETHQMPAKIYTTK